MKKYKLNILILILVSIIIMYLIMKDNFYDIVNYLFNSDLKYLFLGLLLMVLNVLFQSFSIRLYLREIKKDYKFKDSFILMSSALFFNAITPFSSGGQPFQMYLLKKQGIKVTESGNALLQNFISYQLALILLGTASVILNKFFHIIPNTGLLRNIVMIGYIINVVILLLLLFLGKAKNINTKVFNKIFNFIFSFKFIRNREHLREVASNKIDEFYSSSKYFKNNKLIFLKSILYNMASLIFLYIVPLFVFYSIHEFNTLRLLDSIVCSSYTFFIGSFVPIPGGTGGLEYAFLEFFRGFTTNTLLSVSMILWRFITYYLSMILGALSLLFVKKKVKQ